MIYYASSISSNIEYEDAIHIETSISEKGLPNFEIFGLITKSIEESRKRILNSFESVGINFPLRNISINLAPAENIKEGTHYDLAIAASILRYTNSLIFDEKIDLFIGELSLDGKVREVPNILYLVLLGKKVGFKRFFIPKGNVFEVSMVPDIKIFSISSLNDLLNLDSLSSENNEEVSPPEEDLPINFSKIIGNSLNKRILSLALAGNHHLLLVGFPGSGKSLLAKSSIELLPNLEISKALNVAKIYSYSGMKRDSKNFFKPPFRSPHNTSSYSSVFGSGGKNIYPGEIALSNHGVLFLDEFPEFNRLVLEGLRVPLEDKKITISRGKSKKTFETDFILISAMNPCKCGYFNHPKIECKCLPVEIKRYQNRISGPILDRIHFQVNHFGIFKNTELDGNYGFNFDDFLKLKSKIEETRNWFCKNLMIKMPQNDPNILSNKVNQIEITDKAIITLNSIQEKYSISNRKYFKILNLAQTIAIFDSKFKIDPEVIFESLSLAGFRN